MRMANVEQLDYLIVGQGLAGTLLSHFLLLENQRIKIIDTPAAASSSKIAAGIVNPVTGRRIAKSWRYEELFPFAKNTYLALEESLQIKIWQERNILRALHNNFEENEWLRRSAFPDYKPYFEAEANLDGFEGKIGEAFAWGELCQCAQVDMPKLIRTFREKLYLDQLLLEEDFDYQKINFKAGRVLYNSLSAKKIIFCEGAQATNNPYFNYLPFVVTKGELLLVEIPGARFEKMLKHHLFVVPLQDDLYWVGSTSRFEFADGFPSVEMRQRLEEDLGKTIKIPFKVVNHLAGIRPTVFDVRPFLGVHPVHAGLAIFNGLGTKGASLGPFFARQMTDFLLEKGTLDKEVNIDRFRNKSN